MMFGKAECAIVLDKFEPASFKPLRWALRQFLGKRGAGEDAVGVDGVGADAAGGSGADSAVCVEADGPEVDALRFVQSDFRTLLPDLLHSLGEASTVGVVACHACNHPPYTQTPRMHSAARTAGRRLTIGRVHHPTAGNHLSDDIIDTCTAAGVDFAVMPCCHRTT